MKLKFARSKLDKSIFLAGPTPRDETILSWRLQAIEILRALDFDGSVFIPESEDWKAHDDYNDQVHWEWEGLNQSTVIVFWVPRELETMPGFTTNVEYGLAAHSSKCLLGYPKDAQKMTYLRAVAQRFHIPVFNFLGDILTAAVEQTKQPFGCEPLKFYGAR